MQNSPGRHTRIARLRLVALAMFLTCVSLPSAQDVTEPALKAAFLYNFVKFTEWPAGVLSVGQPFVLCVQADNAVGDALGQAVKRRALAGHPLTVSTVPTVPSLAEVRGCHLLYLSGVSAGQAAQIVSALRDLPILTVSDVSGFAEQGGIAEIFFDAGHLRFDVRAESAKRARLKISSSVLVLSKRK